MDREGGNKEKMRKCRERISLNFHILSPFPLHFLILSPFSRSPAARLQQVVQPCSWVTNYQPTTHENIPKGSLPGSFFCISTENTLYTVHMYETWELHNQEVTQVVGILARARKNRLVHYEGETLWQVTLPLLFNNWRHGHIATLSNIATLSIPLMLRLQGPRRRGERDPSPADPRHHRPQPRYWRTPL